MFTDRARNTIESADSNLVRRIVRTAAVVAIIPFALLSCTMLFEYVGASEIVGISGWGGGLTWHTSQGPVWQGLGRVTVYPKRGQLKFVATKKADGTYEADGDTRIKIGFNDGGEGKILGSLNYELPNDTPTLTKLHGAYPTIESLETGLLKPALVSTLYLTGQLMSSHESYRERRTQIVQFVEDQVQNGVYQSRSKTETLEGGRQRVAAEIIYEKGQPARVNAGEVKRFGVRVYNFAIEDLDYSPAVDKQIAAQQEITMAVETAVAKAKEAEQNEITAGAQGRAVAEAERQKQAAINAKLIAEAEGRKLAAEQDRLAAEQEKQATILRAQGDAEARRLVMAADNALDKRLAAEIEINKNYAGAMAQMKLPSVIMGGSTTGGTNIAQQFMELMTAKAAKDVADAMKD